MLLWGSPIENIFLSRFHTFNSYLKRKRDQHEESEEESVEGSWRLDPMVEEVEEFVWETGEVPEITIR